MFRVDEATTLVAETVASKGRLSWQLLHQEEVVVRLESHWTPIQVNADMVILIMLGKLRNQKPQINLSVEESLAAYLWQQGLFIPRALLSIERELTVEKQQQVITLMLDQGISLPQVEIQESENVSLADILLAYQQGLIHCWSNDLNIMVTLAPWFWPEDLQKVYRLIVTGHSTWPNLSKLLIKLVHMQVVNMNQSIFSPESSFLRSCWDQWNSQ